jgi:hypothetical protein
MLLDQLRLERAVSVAGHRNLDRPHLGEHRLAARAIAGVLSVAAGRIMLSVAEVIIELALQRGLQHGLGQSRQQPAFSSQLKTLGTRPIGQLLDQLLIDRIQRVL